MAGIDFEPTVVGFDVTDIGRSQIVDAIRVAGFFPEVSGDLEDVRQALSVPERPLALVSTLGRSSLSDVEIARPLIIEANSQGIPVGLIARRGRKSEELLWGNLSMLLSPQQMEIPEPGQDRRDLVLWLQAVDFFVHARNVRNADITLRTLRVGTQALPGGGMRIPDTWS